MLYIHMYLVMIVGEGSGVGMAGGHALGQTLQPWDV